MRLSFVSGQGSTFGEMALLSDDCIRTASIITDTRSDMIVIGRSLYARSVQSVLKNDFEDKQNFINNCRFFQVKNITYVIQSVLYIH